MAVFGLRDTIINIIGQHRCHDTQNTHHKDPHQQLNLILGRHSQQDERHQGDTRHAIGLKTVGGRTNRVTGIVTCAVGNHTGVAGVVLTNLEHHLHQVTADVGNLGEDTAGDTQCTGTQRLADGKADKAAASQVGGHEQQNSQHQHQLNADEQDTDAHACGQWDVQQVKRTATKRGKRHAGVGIRVHAHTIPRHGIRAHHTNDCPTEDHQYLPDGHVLKHGKVKQHGKSDKCEQNRQEFALLFQIGRAGLENHIANLKHGLVCPQFTHFVELPVAK